MHSVTDEIDQLQLKILELEKLKILELEKRKKLIDYNFNVINDILTEKKLVLIIIDILNQFH